MPGVPVYSLLLVCVQPLPSAHETAGAAGTRHSPRPLWGRELNAQLGRIAPRDREVVCGIVAKPYVELEQRHCERSEAIHSFFTWRAGLLRFARNDETGRENVRPTGP